MSNKFLLLQIIGEDIQRSKPEKFTDFLLKVRQMLISDSLTPVTRCVLLHLLELHLLRWPLLLPDKTGEWYASVLGDRVLARRNVISVTSNYPSRSNGQEKSKEVIMKANMNHDFFMTYDRAKWKDYVKNHDSVRLRLRFMILFKGGSNSRG